MQRDTLNPLISKLALGRSLSREESALACSEILLGRAGDARIAAFLTALKIKGETAAELAGAVDALRSAMVADELQGDSPTDPFNDLIDTCGTGGDGASTLNVSTAAAIVVAAAGGKVAKHGNRSATGNSSSADLLAELGIVPDAPPRTARACLQNLGITFLFAPLYHPGLRHAAQARRMLPFRTLFNLAGPAVNPLAPTYQLIGVSSQKHLDLMAECFAILGRPGRVALVHSQSGLDEVSPFGPTEVAWVEAGVVRRSVWNAADFGLEPAEGCDITVAGPAESARKIRDVLASAPGAARSFVLANSAAGLFVAGKASSLREGVEQARAAIDSGAASALLDRWASATRAPDLEAQANG